MGFTKDTIGTIESVGGVSLFDSMRSIHPATHDYAGLMSAIDKIKLDGIEEGANKYIHPDSPAEVGTYMQVVTDEQGHVVGGRLLQDSTLADYKIVDAYITNNNEIVLGTKKLRPQMPGENISWKQVIERPNTIAGYGIKDAYIAERLTGTINEKNLPARLQIELASQQYADGIDVKVEALKTISYENFIYLFDENSARKAKISAIEQEVNSTKNSVSKNAEKIKLLQEQAGDNAAQIMSNDVKIEALRTLSCENFRYLFDKQNLNEDRFADIESAQNTKASDVKVEALKTLSYENFRYLFDENEEHKARFSSIEKTQNGKASDVKVEALKTISYENFKYLFDEMKNMADTITLLAKQLSNMQSKLDNMSGSGGSSGSGGTCQCTDEDVQDTDVDQIFN